MTWACSECCSVEFLKAAPAERRVLLLGGVVAHRSCMWVLTATWRSAQGKSELWLPVLHRLLYPLSAGCSAPGCLELAFWARAVQHRRKVALAAWCRVPHGHGAQRARHAHSRPSYASSARIHEWIGWMLGPVSNEASANRRADFGMIHTYIRVNPAFWIKVVLFGRLFSTTNSSVTRIRVRRTRLCSTAASRSRCEETLHAARRASMRTVHPEAWAKHFWRTGCCLATLAEQLYLSNFTLVNLA